MRRRRRRIEAFQPARTAQSYALPTTPSARASARQASSCLAQLRLVPAQLGLQRRRDALAPRARPTPDRGPRAGPGACAAAARRRSSRPARGAPRTRPRRAGRAGRRRSAAPARRARARPPARRGRHGRSGPRAPRARRRARPSTRGSSATADRRAERDLVRAAGRVARLALDEPVDGHLRHPPPGRQLAARDRDHPARRLVQLGLARDVDGLLRVAGRDQRPHSGVGARQVAGAAATCRSSRSSAAEQVVDVLLGRRDVVVVQLAAEVVVGRAQQRAPEPRQREDRAPAAGRDDRAAADERQVLVAQRDVRPAAWGDARHLRLVVQLLGAQPVGPDAGRVDDVRGPDDELGAARGVAHLHAGGAAGLVAHEFAGRSGGWRMTAPKRSASPSTVRTRRASSVWQS